MQIDCAVYEDGFRKADIDVGEMAHWRGRPNCFVWVALKDATAEELAAMQAQFGLHELAIEDAVQGHQRPKIEEYEETLFAVLHLVDCTHGKIHRGELAMFIGKDFILTVRRGSEQPFAEVRARTEREPHLLKHGPMYVFYALCDAVVDRYFPLVETLEAELEAIEKAMFTGNEPRGSIRQLYELKRKVGKLRHAVLPLLDAFTRFFGARMGPSMGPTQDYFRDVHDHVLLVNGAIETLRDTIGTALQVNLSMVTIEQSEISKRLAAWAAIFAVMTALAGIWGMNFAVMPELSWRYGYLAALGVMACTTGYLYHRFRKAGWM